MEALIVDKPRVASLLAHFAEIADFREPWRVALPLPEVLLLAVCGTIAAGDDYEEIVDWGNAHLRFLRRFLPVHFGGEMPGAPGFTDAYIDRRTCFKPCHSDKA